MYVGIHRIAKVTLVQRTSHRTLEHITSHQPEFQEKPSVN